MTQVTLLLERFQHIKTISNHNHKSIQLFVNRNTGQHAIAKIQPSSLMKDSKVRNVLHQASFTQVMQGHRGAPFMIWSGRTKQQKIVLLVQELGYSLKEYLQMCKGKFSLKTVCMLGVQMIQIVKSFHDKGFILSNVSIELFQFGKGSKCLDLFINNMSQCMVYKDFKTMRHVLQPRQYFRNPQNIFQSSAVYKNQQKSRKDDLESIFLILIFMLKGELPWQKTFKTQSKYQPVDENFLQLFNNTKKICEGTPFCDLLQDCRLIQFSQQPAYHWYILKLKSILYFLDEQYDYCYDWMTSKTYIQSQAVTKHVPTFMTEKDQQFISYFEDNVFPFVEVDQIWNKHEMYQSQRQPSHEQKFDPFRHKQDISAEANKQLMDIIDMIEDPEQKQKAIKVEEEKINHKIMSKKMSKQECLIM